MGNKLGKKFKSGWCLRPSALSCPRCWKRRKRPTPTVGISEKSANPLSSPITRTSTTVSPSRSPPEPSSPLVADIQPISAPGRHNLTGLTLVAPSPQQQSPWATYATNRSHAPQLSSICSPSTHISQGKQPEKDVSTVDSGSPNLDVFDEAWGPGSGLKLADGSELPWSKGTSSPSAAARYLDDIEDGF